MLKKKKCSRRRNFLKEVSILCFFFYCCWYTSANFGNCSNKRNEKKTCGQGWRSGRWRSTVDGIWGAEAIPRHRWCSPISTNSTRYCLLYFQENKNILYCLPRVSFIFHPYRFNIPMILQSLSDLLSKFR